MPPSKKISKPTIPYKQFIENLKFELSKCEDYILTTYVMVASGILLERQIAKREDKLKILPMFQ